MDDRPLKSCDEKQIVYLVMAVGNADGTVDMTDLPEGFYATEAAAIEAAKGETMEYGLESVIYLCTPVATVRRKFQVKKLQEHRNG